MQFFCISLHYTAVESAIEAMIMAQLDRRFPALDVWQSMSESEQDALLAKIERARRRSDGLTSILMGLLVIAAMSSALYLASSFHL
jgi:hypothetical protein